MKITKKIIIERSAESVWHTLATDFDKAYEWMSIVPHSYEKTEGEKIENAPMVGRVCEFSEKPDGFRADESITFIDNEQRKMTVRVVPKNAPGALPLKENNLDIEVHRLGENRSEVVWIAHPTLKLHGKLFSPLMKMGLGKSFAEILEELKVFMETGKPHPRKLKKSA